MHDPTHANSCSHERSAKHACSHDHSQPRAHDCSPALSRRRVLTGATAGAALALAGCTQIGNRDGATTSENVPGAVTLTTDDACEVCGMIIPNHPGPTTEIFYPGEQPSGHENPARFDSTWEAFNYDFERQDRGWTRAVMYVTDYSNVDYRTFEEQGDTMISTHVNAEDFVAARKVTFVVGSEVKGAMGKDLIAFSKESDAQSFKDEWGGELVTVDDVTPQMIAQLGM
ncbi:nitrous oxide reductase accessory protein NosL [Halorientalis brevis]|uniref:Nitrous oxide reductase accessory protein NosL n=1 Tax=Halorientalis brevis TaxID=1126241 RepID=A0ABD6CCN4_9EURY|nr:nitrous oxide reductase accessory protein NosL [Halorientalis brevis]